MSGLSKKAREIYATPQGQALLTRAMRGEPLTDEDKKTLEMLKNLNKNRQKQEEEIKPE